MIVLRGRFGNGVDHTLWIEERDPKQVRILSDHYRLELGKMHQERDDRHNLINLYVLVQEPSNAPPT